MPVVPFTSRSAQSQPISKVDPTFLMMAAAELHEAGRLVEPTESIMPLKEQPATTIPNAKTYIAAKDT